LLIPTVTCSEITLKKIKKGAISDSRSVDEQIKIIHNPFGCGQTGKDLEQTERTLINIGKNPNVKSVLILSLGCESINYEHVADEISKVKQVSSIKIQDSGGNATISKGINELKKLKKDLSISKRKEVDISNLTIGLKCGGSDFTSGLISNPIVGRISDWIVENRGSSIIGEIPEFIGAERLYSKRGVTPEVQKKILKTILQFESKLKKEAKMDFRNAQPSPGNIKGGITTIEEKSLGAVKKSGNCPVTDVLDYSEIPSKKGHFLMNTPGFDIESVSGITAGGANIVLFTTGLGTPTGNPVVPVVKITANSNTVFKMTDFIDFDASPVMDLSESFNSCSERLKKTIIQVANGKNVKAEENEQYDFGIYRVGPTY
jgi:altronate dehydratase large subunit